MSDYLTLSTTPTGEQCVQVGTPEYSRFVRLEARAFIAQLERMHGEPPEGARFALKSFPHDFGTYHELAVVYDTESEAATDYAFQVEGGLPETWDDTARKELQQAGYYLKP